MGLQSNPIPLTNFPCDQFYLHPHQFSPGFAAQCTELHIFGMFKELHVVTENMLTVQIASEVIDLHLDFMELTTCSICFCLPGSVPVCILLKLTILDVRSITNGSFWQSIKYEIARSAEAVSSIFSLLVLLLYDQILSIM